LSGYCEVSEGSVSLIGIEVIKHSAEAEARLNAGDIGILAGAFAAAFFAWPVALLLLFMTFLLSLLSARLWLQRASRHQFSPPALMPPPRRGTSAATATESTTATAPTFARGFRTLIYGDRTAFKIRSVKFCYRIRSFLLGRHLDKSEAFAASGVSIRDDRCGIDFPGLRKQLRQTVFSG
jgi:hypothetical protein